MPRARLHGPDSKTTEWNSQVLRAYQRRTVAADALIASTYLAGTNTRRVRRALKALFGGAVSGPAPADSQVDFLRVLTALYKWLWSPRETLEMPGLPFRLSNEEARPCWPSAS